MKVSLIPSCCGVAEGEPAHQYLTSFLINDVIAIDAGGLGFYKTPVEQARIKHILISHSHMDHIASLPIFLENIYDGTGDCVTVHASKTVLDTLRKDLFNNRLWPDFIDLSRERAPFLRLEKVTPGKPLELEGLRITPVPVHHIIPTMGYIIEDAGKAVVIPGDTGPTEAIWKAAQAIPALQAVFLEATFPNEMNWLAEAAGHLTPSLFAAEMRKVNRPVQFVAVHIKSRWFDQVVAELNALGLPNLSIGQSCKPYTF